MAACQNPLVARPLETFHELLQELCSVYNAYAAFQWTSQVRLKSQDREKKGYR